MTDEREDRQTPASGVTVCYRATVRGRGRTSHEQEDVWMVATMVIASFFEGDLDDILADPEGTYARSSVPEDELVEAFLEAASDVANLHEVHRVADDGQTVETFTGDSLASWTPDAVVSVWEDEDSFVITDRRVAVLPAASATSFPPETAADARRPARNVCWYGRAMPESAVTTMPPMQPDQRHALNTGRYGALTDAQLDDMADRALTVGDSAAARSLATEMNRRKQARRDQLAAELTGRR